MASRIVTAIGAMTVARALCPPYFGSGRFAPGISPNTSSRASGMPTTTAGAPGSRRKTLASAAVSLVRTDTVSPSFRPAAGECDEGVVEAGLLDAQVSGDHAFPGEQRCHRVQDVAVAADHETVAA